ncbi:MAG: hypothetical protein AB1468_05160 [Candidatus Micrarchaeota archaeon]
MGYGKNVVLASVLIVIVSQIVHTVGAVLTMDYYLDPSYWGVWSRLMMPGPGGPPMEFYYTSLAFSFVGALIYAATYGILKKSIPGKGAVQKGLTYGALLFMVGSVPGYLALIELINLPAMLVFEWALESLVILLIAGVIIAKMLK